MAIDRVKPLVIEEATNGTEIAFGPTELDPSEDYVSTKGIALENLDTFTIDKTATDMRFIDPVNGTSTLKELRTAINNTFDNSSNGFTATNVQAAIEESASVSRFSTMAGFDGTGSSGRWLEFFPNNPSNNNPFIMAEDSQLVAVSLVTSAGSATGTATIYKNGVSFQTISLAAQKKNSINGLSLALVNLDEISIQITSGSISRPQICLFIRTIT